MTNHDALQQARELLRLAEAVKITACWGTHIEILQTDIDHLDYAREHGESIARALVEAEERLLTIERHCEAEAYSSRFADHMRKIAMGDRPLEAKDWLREQLARQTRAIEILRAAIQTCLDEAEEKFKKHQPFKYLAPWGGLTGLMKALAAADAEMKGEKVQ